MSILKRHFIFALFSLGLMKNMDANVYDDGSVNCCQLIYTYNMIAITD